MARDVPNVEHAANSRAYELYVRNGVQAIQYLSWQLENDPFAKLIFESYDLLVSQLEPIDKQAGVTHMALEARESCF